MVMQWDNTKIQQKEEELKKQSAEEVAHKTAWSAVKKKYKKKGDRWMKRE